MLAIDLDNRMRTIGSHELGGQRLLGGSPSTTCLKYLPTSFNIPGAMNSCKFFPSIDLDIRSREFGRGQG